MFFTRRYFSKLLVCRHLLVCFFVCLRSSVLFPGWLKTLALMVVHPDTFCRRAERLFKITVWLMFLTLDVILSVESRLSATERLPRCCSCLFNHPVLTESAACSIVWEWGVSIQAEHCASCHVGTHLGNTCFFVSAGCCRRLNHFAVRLGHECVVREVCCALLLAFFLVKCVWERRRF